MTKLIAIIGNTGAGKTTLAKALAKVGNFELAMEQHEERPYQGLFKTDNSFALANQVDYLLLRAEQEAQLRKAQRIGLVDGGLDLDFYGFSSLFHTVGKLDDAGFNLCTRLHTFCRTYLPPPEIYIHVAVPIHHLANRLSSRQRINISTLNDLPILENFIAAWLKTVPAKKIIQINGLQTSPTYEELVPGIMEKINLLFDNDKPFTQDS